jgi:hypothetical protein
MLEDVKADHQDLTSEVEVALLTEFVLENILLEEAVYVFEVLEVIGANDL